MKKYLITTSLLLLIALIAVVLIYKYVQSYL